MNLLRWQREGVHGSFAETAGVNFLVSGESFVFLTAGALDQPG
jgi:hypothetical protein